MKYSKPMRKSHFSNAASMTPSGMLAAIIINGITMIIAKIPLHNESTIPSFSGKLDESEQKSGEPNDHCF